MSDTAPTIDVLLRVEDVEATPEELQQILRVVAAELEHRGAIVEFAETEVSQSEQNTTGVPKGKGSGNLLDVKINLDTLKSIGKWFYDRFIGTSTKVEFEYEGVKFKFEGQAELDPNLAFERFMAAVEAAKRKG